MTIETNHHHGTIEGAGRCPDCRNRNIDLLAGARRRYLCTFTDDNSIAIVRSWAPDPLAAAWATGCNPGGSAGAIEISDETFVNVPEFQLIRGDIATSALDQVRAAMRDHEPCECCGKPY